MIISYHDHGADFASALAGGRQAGFVFSCVLFPAIDDEGRIAEDPVAKGREGMNRKKSVRLLMVGVVLLLCVTPGEAQDQQGRAKAAGKSAGFGRRAILRLCQRPSRGS
jgi:hypothetical protein